MRLKIGHRSLYNLSSVCSIGLYVLYIFDVERGKTVRYVVALVCLLGVVCSLLPRFFVRHFSCLNIVQMMSGCGGEPCRRVNFKLDSCPRKTGE